MADVSAEVYRTNKLLEIENLDWENQLKCAVGGFELRPLFILVFPTWWPPNSFLVFLLIPGIQGFNPNSMGCILRTQEL